MYSISLSGDLHDHPLQDVALEAAVVRPSLLVIDDDVPDGKI